MMRALALSLALLLAGCGGRSNVQLASNTVPSGGVSTGGAVQVQSNSALGVLLAIGVLMGASYASDRQREADGPGYRSNAFLPSQDSVLAPAMNGSRSVNVQDCTRPIVDSSANLRCR
jgi:hypothetical protein